MKEVIKITTTLTSVCIICAFFLSFVYGVAKDKIELNAEKAVNDAIITLAPSAEKIEEALAGEKTIYKLFDVKDNFIGYAFTAQGQGYQGKIKMIAVTGPKLKNLKGIEVIDSIETPGLGAKINEKSFKGQFKNINVEKKLECIKDKPEKNNQIQAITGATVSSRAVINILNKKIKELREILTNHNS